MVHGDNGNTGATRVAPICPMHWSTATKQEDRKPSHHQYKDTATKDNPQGGNDRKDRLWMKWCHPAKKAKSNFPTTLPCIQ
mmetsp:Transcript_9750/g.21046  ORF Transcript_9750/g.21046 Transcript_9750/m.21046 type:complete len:81 (-) Transcript_9750:687-929(-)